MINRSACAFNFSKIFVISKKSEREEEEPIVENKKKPKLAKLRKEMGLFGSQGTDKQIDFQVFSSIKTAKEYFLSNKIFVCGVEITNNSQSIVTQPFKGSTVFLLGNEVKFLLCKLKKQNNYTQRDLDYMKNTKKYAIISFIFLNILKKQQV